ncbi:MAG: 6-bladed beta-propeller, partial [Bacteroidota bacterium]
MKLRYLIILFLVNISCSEKSENNDKIHFQKTQLLTPEKIHEFTSFGDNLLFSKIHDIEMFNDKYYLTDINQNKVFVFNKNWEFTDEFGSYGPGPSEFDGISNIIFNKEFIGISDMESSTVKLFDKTHQFVKSIRRPYVVDSSMEFFMDDNNYIYQQTKRYDLISKYNFDGEIEDYFGSFEEDFSLPTMDRNNQQTNQWHVALANNNLYAVNKCEPLIVTYDYQNRNKNVTYDLSKIEAIESRIKFVNKEMGADPHTNVNYILFSDIVVDDENVYL